MTLEDQDHPEPEAGARRGGGPSVVALRCPRGDDRRGPALQGLPHRDLQHADLVAPGTEADEAVALDPEVASVESQGHGEPWRRVDRGRARSGTIPYLWS